MSPAEAKRTRAKFDGLRARYLALRDARAEHDLVLRLKYGGNYESSWLKAAERIRLEKLTASKSRVGDALFALIQSISPRDWSCGVPAYWVRESLTFEDAVRPIDEPLSVTPPLSRNATEAMR